MTLGTEHIREIRFRSERIRGKFNLTITKEIQ